MNDNCASLVGFLIFHLEVEVRPISSVDAEDFLFLVPWTIFSILPCLELGDTENMKLVSFQI